MWRAGEAVGSGYRRRPVPAGTRTCLRSVHTAAAGGIQKFGIFIPKQCHVWQRQDSSRFQRDDPILESSGSFRPKIPARWSDSGNCRKIPAEDSSTVGNFRKFHAEDSSLKSDSGNFRKIPVQNN
jgi:hypothetical protein